MPPVTLAYDAPERMPSCGPEAPNARLPDGTRRRASRVSMRVALPLAMSVLRRLAAVLDVRRAGLRLEAERVRVRVLDDLRVMRQRRRLRDRRGRGLHRLAARLVRL